MKIVDRIKELNLPFGKYVVIGGVMEVHGIRPANDVDVVVTEELFNDLRKQGWKRKWFFRRVLTSKLLTNGKGAEAFIDYQHGAFQFSTEELIRRADIIDGISFLRLDDLMAFKSEMARKKDLLDVELIKKCLSLK